MQSATIKLFLIHGDPKRLRTAEISNWTGKAVAAPRVELEMSLEREEAKRSGVYFLLGTDPQTGGGVVYVGEAETIKDRLEAHLDREFWSSLIFVGSSALLHIRLADDMAPAGRK